MLLGGDREPLQVRFKYEQLIDFCYICGRIGHMQSQCPHPAADKEKLAYGPWVKVEGIPTHESYKPTDDSGTSPLIPIILANCPLVQKRPTLLGPSLSAVVVEDQSDPPEPQATVIVPNKNVSSLGMECVLENLRKL